MQPKIYFKNLILHANFRKENDVQKGCLEIIEYLFSVDIDKETSFYFTELRNHVSNEINNDDFITSVFYLTRQDIRILEQNFSAFNPIVNNYEPIYKNDVIEMLQDKLYYNPITGNDLTQEQFSQEIITYFNPTSEFIRKIKNHE